MPRANNNRRGPLVPVRDLIAAGCEDALAHEIALVRERIASSADLHPKISSLAAWLHEADLSVLLTFSQVRAQVHTDDRTSPKRALFR